jgi:hypothetical protein
MSTERVLKAPDCFWRFIYSHAKENLNSMEIFGRAVSVILLLIPFIKPCEFAIIIQINLLFDTKLFSKFLNTCFLRDKCLGDSLSKAERKRTYFL